MVATEGALQVQVPPLVASAKVDEPVLQNVEVPVIDATDGAAVTVIDLEVTAVPQLLVTV